MDEKQPDRRGTWADWPVAVIVAAVVIALFAGKPSVGVFVLFWFGVLSLLIRRGAFRPRRDR